MNDNEWDIKWYDGLFNMGFPAQATFNFFHTFHDVKKKQLDSLEMGSSSRDIDWHTLPVKRLEKLRFSCNVFWSVYAKKYSNIESYYSNLK